MNLETVTMDEDGFRNASWLAQTLRKRQKFRGYLEIEKSERDGDLVFERRKKVAKNKERMTIVQVLEKEGG